MMLVVLTAIVPLACVLCFGTWMKARGMVPDEFWRGLEWVSYWVLMPALLVSVIMRAPDLSVPWVGLFTALYGTLALLSGVVWLGWKLGLRHQGFPRLTSLYQGVIRFNTFIALALMAGLDRTLLSHVAIAAACLIVVINVLCVSVLSMQGATSGAPSRITRELSRNPLVLGCLLGALLRQIGVSGESVLGESLRLLGQAALPMGILVLGAGLQADAMRRALPTTGLSLLLQFIIKPLIGMALALAVGLDPTWSLVVLILFLVPTAPSSYILAKQLGGDAPAMAAIVASQTVLAMVTIPVTLLIAASLGVIRLGL
ncbi:MAG: AEC family transporter [Litorivicinaceae bacterium]